ncbi:MAG: hypothetical protein E4H43_03810 [Bacteroidia bacterium]|nr:MAG: hypothetical protein E4H43_03810 [Bacteroidia bacterium]
MKILDLKELLIRSLDKEGDPEKASVRIEEAGVTYKFSEGFHDKVIDSIFSAGDTVVRQIEFVRNLNSVFYRIALTGVAAILIHMISIFVVQGSLSFDSFLGLGDSYDESIVYLLTGN